MATIRVESLSGAEMDAIMKKNDPTYAPKPPPKPGEDPEYDKRLREYQNWDPDLVTVLPSKPPKVEQ